MKIKKMVAPALAALAVSGLMASSAGAAQGEYLQTESGPIPARTIQTPTGPMKIPTHLVEHGPGGSTVVGVICGFATMKMASHYTLAEIEADPFNWCLREPGTITGPLSAPVRVKVITHPATKAPHRHIHHKAAHR